MNRGEFIKALAMVGGTAFAAGCVGDRISTSGSMIGFAAAPLRKVRVALVDLDDDHGIAAIKRLLLVPGVEIAAVWSKEPTQIAKAKTVIAAAKRPEPKAFGGEDGWRAMVESGCADVLYNCCRDTSVHTKISLFAMDRKMHVFTEILAELPGAITLDECWALVEASERNRVHCMMLECCCYGEYELLALNLIRQGKLGEVVRCSGAYVHDQRVLQFKKQQWRLQNALKRKGNFYPTHPLAPLSRCAGINRGDRFESVVSMESDCRSFEGFARNSMKGTALENARFSRGDANVTLIRTVGGKLITLLNDTATPQPYDRGNLISGTKGIMSGFSKKTFRVAFEEALGDGNAEQWFSQEKAAKVAEEFRHPLWKEAGALAKTFKGAGMTFLMDLRWAYCLQNGLPLDSNVYDLAAWGSIVDLSDRSVRLGSKAVEIPDFTAGAWKTASMAPVEEVNSNWLNGNKNA